MMKKTLFSLMAFLLSQPAFAAPAVTVAARALDRGVVIAAGDLDAADAASLPRYAGVLDAAALVGKELRRPIAAGQPMFRTDVMEPLLVRRNQQVTMVLVRGGLSIAVSGKSLDDGSKGATVRVQNPVSRQIVEGEVAYGGVVRVAALQAPAIPAGF
jgi:flagellar basal body P-ring formation protein FlgA